MSGTSGSPEWNQDTNPYPLGSVSWTSQPITQGWQCPQCKRIFGPFVQECSHCNSDEFLNCGGVTVKSSSDTVWITADELERNIANMIHEAVR